MKNYVLFHIPHSSLKIPKMFWSICIVDKMHINNSNILLSDYLTNELIPNNAHKIIFNYSRIFCDVEKFKDDSKEVMSKKGMGVIYTKDCDNTITCPNKKYKNNVIKSYYDNHHNKLNKRVTEVLKRQHNCIIVDLHSYSDEMVKNLLNKDNNPDICIGIDKNYTDQKLIDLTINHFKEYNYTVNINTPYEGTMIPNKYFNKKSNHLNSIMIEINKRIYLNNTNDFIKFQECLRKYYEKLETLEI